MCSRQIFCGSRNFFKWINSIGDAEQNISSDCPFDQVVVGTIVHNDIVENTLTPEHTLSSLQIVPTRVEVY